MNKKSFENTAKKTVIGALITQAIPFPSPAKDGQTEIGFRIKDGQLLLNFQLFDAYGQQIYQLTQDYTVGYNRISIKPETLGFKLAVGVYYFLLIDEQKDEVLSKGKFGVVR